MSKYQSIDALHLVPGDGDELLMESVAQYCKTSVAVMTIYDGPQQLREVCRLSNVYFDSLGARNEGYLRLAWRFRQQIKILNPRVLYLHGFTASIIGAIVSRTFFSGIRFVSVRHHNRRYHSFNLISLKVLIGDQIAIRFSDHLVAVSDSVRETLESEGCPRRKISVIYNGLDRYRQVNDRRINPTTPDRDRKGLKIIAIGKMSHQKDFSTMLHALAQAKSRGLLFTLDVLGSGDPVYEREVRQLADELDIGKRINWAGWQPNIDPWLDASDVFLHTAIDEACPLVIIEAMIHGVPIVSSNAGGCRDLLTGFYSGIIPGNVEEFATAIITVNDNLTASKEYARRIATAAQEKYDAEKMVSNYTELTKSLI